MPPIRIGAEHSLFGRRPLGDPLEGLPHDLAKVDTCLSQVQRVRLASLLSLSWLSASAWRRAVTGVASVEVGMMRTGRAGVNGRGRESSDLVE
jgi:hypothetical protein